MESYFLLSNLPVWPIIIGSLFLIYYLCSLIKKRGKAQKGNSPSQLKKNVEYVHRLIKGHYESISTDEQRLLLENSKIWITKTQEIFYHNANIQNQKKLNRMMKKDDKYDWPNEISSGQARNLTPFLVNVFTEPFPSLHDMPGFHLRDKFTELLVLSGVKKSESHNYGIHINYHLVNHRMTQGIIQFDILYL